MYHLLTLYMMSKQGTSAEGSKGGAREGKGEVQIQPSVSAPYFAPLSYHCDQDPQRPLSPAAPPTGNMRRIRSPNSVNLLSRHYWTSVPPTSNTRTHISLATHSSHQYSDYTHIDKHVGAPRSHTCHLNSTRLYALSNHAYNKLLVLVCVDMELLTQRR